MANLTKKDGIYLARFRFQGTEYKRSLRTRNKDDAEATFGRIVWTIRELEKGELVVPTDVNAGDYIVDRVRYQRRPMSTVAPKAAATGQKVGTPSDNGMKAVVVEGSKRPATKVLVERYLELQKVKSAPSYVAAQRYHLNRFQKFIKADAKGPCDRVTRNTVESFLVKLAGEFDGETVNRYRVTLTQFYAWIAKQEDVTGFALELDGLPKFQGGRDRDPFKTYEEIEAVIQRGGLDEEELYDQWEALYLDTERLAQLLALVRERSQDKTSFMLHAIPAYTGMRRGEVLRLRWPDVDLTHDFVTARSRKQSRKRTEVSRQIDMHSELKKLLLDWQASRPSGQYVLTAADGKSPLNPDQANRLFWLPMRGTGWCLHEKRNLFKVGFHTYRHSFASNLASLPNVDEHVIDGLMGHTTEAMRKRYRHLFPKVRRSAIERLNMPLIPTSGMAS